MLRWLRQLRLHIEPTATVEGDPRPVWQRVAAYLTFRRDW